MVSCSNCEDEVFNEDVIFCANCDARFHYGCAVMTESTFRKMNKERKKKWQCVNCKKVKLDCDQDLQDPYRTRGGLIRKLKVSKSPNSLYVYMVKTVLSSLSFSISSFRWFFSSSRCSESEKVVYRYARACA